MSQYSLLLFLFPDKVLTDQVSLKNHDARKCVHDIFDRSRSILHA